MTKFSEYIHKVTFSSKLCNASLSIISNAEFCVDLWNDWNTYRIFTLKYKDVVK